jgi:hypothetical protein
MSVLVSLAALAIVISLLRRVSRRWMAALVVVLALFAGLPQGIRTPGEFALQFGTLALAGAAAFGFCFWFGRRNYLAYALALCVLNLRGPLVELFGNGVPGAHAQGWIVTGVLAVVLIWMALPASRPSHMAAGKAA